MANARTKIRVYINGLLVATDVVGGEPTASVRRWMSNNYTHVSALRPMWTIWADITVAQFSCMDSEVSILGYSFR